MVMVSQNLYWYKAEVFVLLNANGSNLNYMFVLDNPFIEEGYGLYNITLRTKLADQWGTASLIIIRQVFLRDLTNKN